MKYVSSLANGWKTSSHCLEIPRYPDKETMKEKIVMAMYEGTEGFYVS